MSESTTTVLHVDDNAQFRDLVSTYLERSDPTLSVLSESSPTDALERLQQRSVDCVVSDYEMEQTDGLEFLEAVRSEFSPLPFVLFTGKGSEEIASEAVNAGVDAYYQKQPGTSQYAVLVRHINTLVEKYHAERRLDYLTRHKHIEDSGVGAADRALPDERPETGSTSVAVVEAVAAREDVDPVELLPPLGEVVDTEALDGLFAPQPSTADSAVESATLTYRGYTVTVDGDGRVSVEE
jgi:CheY-like chemotaxis protein